MVSDKPPPGASRRVLVVGTGSIGRRHIKNLLALGAKVGAFSYRATEAARNDFPSTVDFYSDLDEAMATAPDAVVVANRTDLHISVALPAAEAGRDLFIEKPLSSSLQGIDVLNRVVEARDLVVETGFMLRFHPNLIWMKAFLEDGSLGELHYVRSMVGQFLPEWRPGTDHRESYSASGGCGGVILDLVHELDLAAWLFGEVVEVSAMTRHTPSLEIESESIAQITLRFDSDLLAQVHLDYVRPTYGRTLEIVGSNGTLSWDFMPGTVTLTEPGGANRIVNQVSPGYERNHLFLSHMRHFLTRMSKRNLAPASSLQAGIVALRVALAAHLSARTRRFVRPADVSETFSLEPAIA